MAFSGAALAARCPSGSPYASSANTLKNCGMHISPLRAIKPLPGGGKEYTYEEPTGAPFSMNVPPTSFDARRASASELATYGIPPEPPFSSPEHAIWEEMISQGIKFATPPPFIAEAPSSSSSPDEPGTPVAEPDGLGAPAVEEGTDTTEPLVSPPSGSANSQSKIWSGYFDWNGKGTYTHATGYYIEPKSTSSCEKPQVTEPSASYIWAGIGGWYNQDLGQDGTSQHEEGLGEDEAWYEILPAQKHPKGLGIKAIPGKYVEADTHYESGEYKFYMHNLVPEGEAAYGHGPGPIDANVNDFIIERPGKDNLLDFGNVTFQGFTNNKAFAENKTERLQMENRLGEVNAAPAGGISNKYEFLDAYKDCNGLGEEEGEGASAEGPTPVATTEAASSVSESGATLHASVNPEGSDTHYHFEYGTEAENYSASTPNVDAGAGTTTLKVSSVITGLQPGTTYHYRVIADSATGTGAGADTTFTTSGKPPPPPPTVTTEGASGIGTQTATVEGAVNPNGLDAHYFFEYGANATLLESFAPSPPGNDAGSGTSPVKVSVGLTSLVPYTTYFYRTTASNSTGTAYGAEKEFTTLYSPPVYSSEFGSEGSASSFDAIDASGDVWVVDSGSNHVDEFTASGSLIRTIGSEGTGNGQFNYPVGIGINQSAGDVYVADSSNNRIEEFSVAEGKFIRAFAAIGGPHGVAVDSSGNVWVVETGFDRIEKYSSTGTLLAAYGSAGSGNGQFANPFGIAVGASNHVYVADFGNDRVEEFSSEGAYLGKFGSVGSGNGQFEDPYDVASDSQPGLPASGLIFVADTVNQRVQAFTSAGVFLGKFGSAGSGNGQFSGPQGVAVNSSGDVYVVDDGNSRVEKWIPAG